MTDTKKIESMNRRELQAEVKRVRAYDSECSARAKSTVLRDFLIKKAAEKAAAATPVVVVVNEEPHIKTGLTGCPRIEQKKAPQSRVTNESETYNGSDQQDARININSDRKSECKDIKMMTDTKQTNEPITQAEKNNEKKIINTKYTPMPDPEWFSKTTHGNQPQRQMFEHMDDKKLTCAVKKGKHAFGAFKNCDTLARYIAQEHSNAPNYHELLRAGQPQSMFCDLDGLMSELDLKSERDVVDSFEKFIENVFDSHNLMYDPEHSKWLTASAGDKVSVHWLYSKYYFANEKAQKKFWKAMITQFKENSWLGWTDQKGIERFIIDVQVYSKNHGMRAIYSHKEDKSNPRPLLPFSWDVDEGMTMLDFKEIDVADYLVANCEGKELFEVCEEKEKTAMFIPQSLDLMDLLKMPVENELVIAFDECTAQEQESNRIETELRECKLYGPYTDDRDEIVAIVLEVFPDLIKGEWESNILLSMRNGEDGRECFINGEDNKSDNCCVIRKDRGLYYVCHDDGCEGQEKLFYRFDSPPTIHRQDTPSTPQLLNLRPEIKEYNNCKTMYEVGDVKKKIIHKINQYWCMVLLTKTTYIHEYWDYNTRHGDEEVVEKKTQFMVESGARTALKKWKGTAKIEGKSVSFDAWNLWSGSMDRREYNGTEFNPKKFIAPSGKQNTRYNFYTGCEYMVDKLQDVEPLNGGEPFFDHIHKVWCRGNQQQYDYVIHWMASLIQQPWNKMSTCLVLMGLPGCGKGMIVQILADIIGRDYFFHPTSPDSVLGQFNAQLAGKLLVFLDELQWGGNHAQGAVLKKLITEKTIVINQKNIAMTTIANLMNCIMASNEQWVVPADIKSRRYVVMECDDKLCKMDKKKARVYIRDICSVDRKRLAKYLSNIPLDTWDCTAIPMSTGLQGQQIRTLPKLKKWWINILTVGSFDNIEFRFGEPCLLSALHADYREISEDKHMSGRVFNKTFRELVFEPNSAKSFKALVKENTIRKTDSSGRKGVYIKMPSIDVCRAYWDISSGWTPDWE